MGKKKKNTSKCRHRQRNQYPKHLLKFSRRHVETCFRNPEPPMAYLNKQILLDFCIGIFVTSENKLQISCINIQKLPRMRGKKRTFTF